MNPSLFSSEIFSHFFIFFIIFTPNIFLVTSQTITYSDHCNSFAPEAFPTDEIFIKTPFLEPVTSHYTGGQNIFDQDLSPQRSIRFILYRNLFKTNVTDTYKIQARLGFFSTGIYHRPANYNYRTSTYRRPLLFNLNGFWSVSTNKLCMVGSTGWFTKEGNPLKLNVVLKLKFARFITLNTSLVSGTLESLASPHDFEYFYPISMLGFPIAAPFEYANASVSNQKCDGREGKTQQDSANSMYSFEICWIFTQKFTTYKLEYPDNCKKCSLFGQENGDIPSFMSLYGIQCSQEHNKLRFLVEFQDRRHTPIDQSFNPDIALIGEGTWNGTKNELCIVACRILNKSDPLGSAHVGDCSVRLTLWFPKIRSIKNTHDIEGQIWSTKITEEMGSSQTVKFKSFDHSSESYARKYEYTQMEKARRICPRKKHGGEKYRHGYYGYEPFDMSVKHKNMVSTGFAIPVSLGKNYRLYNSYSTVFNPNSSQLPETIAPVAYISAYSYNSRTNISFEISFRINTSFVSRSGISSLNLSSTDDYRVEISAEGFYDDDAGQICMVGCRNLNSKNESFDCEIVVKFQLPQDGSLLKGSIASLREKTDVLYFEHLDVFSPTYTETEAIEALWRMDLEIIMVLISETFTCVFIGRQLLHLKKRPEMVNFISVLMLLILTFGHMAPLVLNFEAIFSNTHKQENIGLFEVNEVIVRIMTMVALILQFRLLQLTWTAKTNPWIHEIRTLVICLPMYIIGGSTMLLVNWRNNNYTTSSQLLRQSQRSVWGDLTSYAGLTLDGFLLPQLILNLIQISKGNALSHSFYMGITFVQLLPHAYDLYTGPRHISHQFDRLYLYANPRADFHSPCWNIAISCGGIVLTIIVFLQQLLGGRFMFPKRFLESVEC